jgi:hypothetical protein
MLPARGPAGACDDVAGRETDRVARGAAYGLAQPTVSASMAAATAAHRAGIVLTPYRQP